MVSVEILLYFIHSHSGANAFSHPLSFDTPPPLLGLGIGLQIEMLLNTNHNHNPNLGGGRGGGGYESAKKWALPSICPRPLFHRMIQTVLLVSLLLLLHVSQSVEGFFAMIWPPSAVNKK